MAKREGKDFFLCECCGKYYYRSQMAYISGMKVELIEDKSGDSEYPYFSLNADKRYGATDCNICKKCKTK